MIPLATVIWLLGIIHNSRQFFLESPSNLSTIAGESITFRCAAEKSPEPIVYSQWKSNTGSLLGYHQEGVLPGHQGRFSYVKQNAEELHLKITHVNLDDDGEYECQMLHPEAGPIRAKAFLNILVPPQLVYFSNYQPNSVIAVKENTPLNITCVVPNVKPEPQVLWYMDGKVMSRDVKQASMPHLNKTFTVYTSLVIQPGRSDHGKIVTCEVVQKETETRITTNTTLDVLFPPSEPTVEILGNPSVLRAGDNVTVACAVTGGNPPPDVFWYHENKRLQSHSTLDTRTKEIRNVYSFIATQNDNMAEYECRANNSHSGNAKRKALKFEVNYPPASVELFGESNIRQGSSAMIQCKSLPSNPASQITWVINGRTVPTPTQREFFMENGIVSSSNISVHSNELSQDAHQINVECIATNPEGSSAKQHLIKIIAPPKAPRITGLEDRKFFEGDIVNVTCEAQGGNPLAELSWYRGSEKVNGAHNEVAGLSSFSTLALRVDRTMNTQRLKCEATNAALDEPLIESQYLSVYYPPRRVLIRPAETSDQRLLINKPARLVCGTLSSNPAAQITWQFSRANDDKVHLGDVSLNETTRDNGYNVENVLSFVPTEEYDGTVVHCIANHPEWKHSVNTSFPLNVMYPPKMLVNDPVTVIMSEGDSFKENLTVRGNPAVSLWQWRKNGVPFDHTIGRVFARGAVLSGKQLLSTDAGVYTLTATNSVGSTNITIKLAVEYSARITSISTPVIAATGDTVLLECEAEGEPSKSNMINWYKNGEPLPTQYRGNKKAILRLNATEQQSGEYICRADNGIGVPAEGKTFLLVNSAPRVLPVARYSKTAGILGGVAKARCKVYAVPTVEFVWEKDEQLIKKNSSKYSIVNTQIDYSTYESTLWIKNIVPDDYTKTVKCIAKNSFGTDYLSIPIIPPTNPEEPFNLTMTNSTLNTISVAWEPRFDGGSDQIFEIKYKKQNDDLIHLVNTTHTNLRLSGLAIANTYYFQIRAINARGFASGWTSPVIFATLNEDGVNIAMVQNRELKYIKYFPLLLLVAIICILLAILVACCLLCSRNKKRKLREKTEMARTAINGGDVRQVQMYGTMMGHDGMTRHDIDDRPDMSEDEHSVRTMIEVSPNGYMQPIEPMLYESTGLLEYDYQNGRSYMGSSQGTTGRNITYANVPYPEPPQPSYHHHSNWNSLQRQSNNNTSPQHHLSTFINPMGVRAGPINYAQLDGDLV